MAGGADPTMSTVKKKKKRGSGEEGEDGMEGERGGERNNALHVDPSEAFAHR